MLLSKGNDQALLGLWRGEAEETGHKKQTLNLEALENLNYVMALEGELQC